MLTVFIIFSMIPWTVCADTAAAAREQLMQTKPLVGVYYYPWYRPERDQWRQVMRLHLKNLQQPKCGRYDSRDAMVIGDHIEQSLRGGIGFWAVSWWGPNEAKDVAFREHILKHPDAGKLKYAVLYESTGRFGRFDRPRYDKWLSDLAYIKQTYFDNPNYLRVNDRPVVFVYLSREYFRNKGHEALRQMREQFPEIYLVGDDVFFGSSSGGEYRAEWAGNFDAVTAYDVYGQSVGPWGGTRKAVQVLADNYRQARQTANSVGTAFIPAIAPGYNDTAVREGHPGRARYFTDVQSSREGDVFREMIRRAAMPNLDPSCGNIIMVTSFNEWYEDSQIEATAGTSAPSSTDDSDSGTYYTGGQVYNDYGYLYLDILREEVSGSSAVNSSAPKGKS